MSKTVNFEKSMARLEEIVELLEDNNQPLDKMIELFEEGLKLSKECDAKLKEFENRIEDIISNNEEN